MAIGVFHVFDLKVLIGQFTCSYQLLKQGNRETENATINETRFLWKTKSGFELVVRLRQSTRKKLWVVCVWLLFFWILFVIKLFFCYFYYFYWLTIQELRNSHSNFINYIFFFLADILTFDACKKVCLRKWDHEEKNVHSSYSINSFTRFSFPFNEELC